MSGSSIYEKIMSGNILGGLGGEEYYRLLDIVIIGELPHHGEAPQPFFHNVRRCATAIEADY